MRITRRGASANHGLKFVELRKLKFRWNPTTETFDIAAGESATDFSTYARHNYTLKLSLAEMAMMIRSLGEECKSIDAEEFEEAFAAAVPATVRIMARASAVN